MTEKYIKELDLSDKETDFIFHGDRLKNKQLLDIYYEEIKNSVINKTSIVFGGYEWLVTNIGKHNTDEDKIIIRARKIYNPCNSFILEIESNLEFYDKYIKNKNQNMSWFRKTIKKFKGV